MLQSTIKTAQNFNDWNAQLRLRSPVHLPKSNGHAGTDQTKQSSLIESLMEWDDQNDPSVEKDMEVLALMKSVDSGAENKHVSEKKEGLVTRKRTATSNKNC